jgi:hypothetical protein
LLLGFGAWNLLFSKTQPYLDSLFDFLMYLCDTALKTSPKIRAIRGEVACGGDEFAT